MPIKSVTAKKSAPKKAGAKKPVSKAGSKAGGKSAKPTAKKAAVKKVTAKAGPKRAAVKKPTKVATAKAVKKPVKTPVKISSAKARKPAKTEALGLPEQAREIVLRILDERQAEQIVTIDLRGRSSMADYLIIASGRAARQIAAIADLIQAELAKIGIKRVRTEGTGEGNWVLVDTGDIILHLFRPEVRQFYNIEQIYGEDVPAA